MIDDQLITLHSRTACCVMDKITTRQAMRYTEIMLETGDSVRGVIISAAHMLPGVFGCMRPADIMHASVTEVVTALKALHFVMQEIVLPHFGVLSDEEKVEREASAFDDYDRENGYAELDEASIWESCRDNIQNVVQASIRIMRQSYTETMEEELIKLIDHLKWEIDHQPERKEGGRNG